MTDYSNIFKETVTSKEIALAIRNDYPNWRKDYRSAVTGVNDIAKNYLHIIPKEKGRPQVFYKKDALKIVEYIIGRITERDKDITPASETEKELIKRCRYMGCSKRELIDKALLEYFKRHPYEGKTYQELVELLEKRDAEREVMYI